MKKKKVIGKGIVGFSVPSQKWQLTSLEDDIKRLNLKEFYLLVTLPYYVNLKLYKKKVINLFKKHNKKLAKFTTKRKKGDYYGTHIYKPYKK